MGPSIEHAFGRRLRMERERRTITLSSISDNTKISQSLLEALERDDVSRWPSGIFRRSFIRAYAQAIGLDPEVVAREFLERFPDPAMSLAETAAAEVPTTVAARGASVLKMARPDLGPPRGTTLRLTIAAPGSAFAGGGVVQEVKRRWAAAACDVGVVIGVAVLLFLVVNEFWRPFGVTALGYYVGSIVILGNTPGVSLFAPASGRGLDVRHRLEALDAIVRNLRRT